ncbi:MAG TPA: hypothetical protein DD979_10115 [Gammaproteobacteria bacterium]|nr:hypothetical protein [Gammaproteobacteria bacterium]
MRKKNKASELQEIDVGPLLKFSTVILLFYTVNQLHFPSSLGLPGVNVLNIIFFSVYLMHLAQKRPDPLKPYLTARFVIVMAFMVYGFVVAQIRMPLSLMEDITYLKTGLFYPLYFFLAFHLVQSRNDTRFFVVVLMGVAGIAGLEAIREALDYGIGNYKEANRAAGPFGENFTAANRAGIFYSMFYPLFVAFALFASGYPKLIRMAAMAGAVVLILAVFFTYSRQSYFICLLLTGILFMRKNWFMVLVLMFAMLNYDLWVPNSAIERIEGTQQVNEHGKEEVDESTASRWVLWQGGFAMSADMPWGIGLNRFKREIGNYTQYPGKDAHNYYVLIFAETSPLSSLFQIILVVSLALMGMRLARAGGKCKDDFAQTFGQAFFVMSLGMILGNVYGSPFFSGEVMGLYWFAAGMVCRYVTVLDLEVKQLRRERRKRRNAAKGMVARA